MDLRFDKWLLLKFIEFLLVLACLIANAITDDEETQVYLGLQKLSREWPFLINASWNQIGSAFAWSIFGGYLIITAGLFLGRLTKELPSKMKVMEFFFLGLGSVLFIILGCLELTGLDSIPTDLIDNAAVKGSLSILVGLLFIVDMAAPRLKRVIKETQTSHLHLGPLATPFNGNGTDKQLKKETLINGNSNDKVEVKSKASHDQTLPKRFDIYGNDRKKRDSIIEIAEQLEQYSPVFTKIQRPYYGQREDHSVRFLPALRDEPDAAPGQPGYVQHTAKRWGQQSLKAPQSSPADS